MTSPTSRNGLRALPPTIIWLTSALAIATLGLIVVGIALLIRDKQPSTLDQPGADPSTSDSWIASVCKAGTYQNGKGGNLLTGSTGSAMCHGNPRGTIFVGTYESEFRFDDALARFPTSSQYATLTDDSGLLWVFFSPNHYTDLEELTQFGFVVHTA